MTWKPEYGSVGWDWREGVLCIARADPRVLVGATFLDLIRSDPGPIDGVLYSLNGDLLRIEAPNRTVIYRIGEKVPDILAYYAEWPD